MKNPTDRVVFTKDMRRDYTILVPNMLPYHFRMITRLLNQFGYKVELLETSGSDIVETGLKYVHNDSCYPAQLVIGQFVTALQSGKYDPHKTALLFSQTGGGCRASNYISLLRKALERAGYPYVPVISLNFAGLESNPGFRLTLPLLQRMIYAVVYGDLLMLLTNQCKPYEVTAGASAALADTLSYELAESLANAHVMTNRELKRTMSEVVRRFAAIPRRSIVCTPVGIVGEIYVKYSPLGNNALEDYLVSEQAEPVLAGFLDFALATVYNGLADHHLYRRDALRQPVQRWVYRWLLRKQRDLIAVIRENSAFRAPTPFERKVKLLGDYIGIGMKMGEGWLLTAEILELLDEGIPNVICVQPFGCLPNHVAGRGVMQRIKRDFPHANIAAVDYDSGTSAVNQHNRIKLMLQSARETAEEAATV